MWNPLSIIKHLASPACILWLGLSGCTHTSGLTEPSGESADVAYTVIYYIHADSDYLFHDPDQVPVRANRHVLQSALETAEEARSGEVFIYYQLPEKRILGLFPRRNSLLYHYVDGQLTAQIAYRHPDRREEFLTTAAQLYHHIRNHSRNGDQSFYFLFFGHEIPRDEGTNYHRTMPGMQVNTQTVARGIRSFLEADGQRFDLIVLSTCNNGTPEMAHHLMPFTNALLASPQNLHLSHIDPRSISMLESHPASSPLHIARSMANNTFQRLSESLQIAVTLALYDFEHVRNYHDELYSLIEANEAAGRVKHFRENTDCAQFSFFNPEKFKPGVETWFSPARFGRSNAVNHHSGWGCRPLDQ